VSQSDPATLCARCHLSGAGCCRLGGFNEDQVFPLTLGEIEAMARASGLDQEQFTVADRPPREFLELAAALHPVLITAMPRGNRLRLRIQPGGECFFLGPQGCALPSQARPLYCRLYPFFFTMDERLMVLGAENCLAQQGAVSWREVLSRLGEKEAHLRGLFARLKELAADHQRRCDSD
jgi:Fe-S-cluster containining protein